MAEQKYTEAELKLGDELTQKALITTEKGDFNQAEIYWTELIDHFPENPALWSNRGNARVSQNKLVEAIADYDQSIKLYPSFPDAYLNRGIAFEGLKKWENAINDYNRVLELNPEDAAAYNNRGNAKAGMGNYESAIADYQKAMELDRNFVFAQDNYALSLYQVGETKKATKIMEGLIRKYPQFADIRAALTVILWADGKQGEAESNWVSVMGLDQRYKDVNWVKNIRRWPPSMVDNLQNFLLLIK
ncbi:MAG TPA: tetratricopeptide repeat protein, partial [Allocoleopsis sp.]